MANPDEAEADSGLAPQARLQQPPTKNIIERIGILVVHGIGEQNRYEHLQSVAKRLVNAASLLYDKRVVNVEMFPGVDNRSDISILIKRGGRNSRNVTCIDLHEVWWRDLGQRVTPWTVVKFWAAYRGRTWRLVPGLY